MSKGCSTCGHYDYTTNYRWCGACALSTIADLKKIEIKNFAPDSDLITIKGSGWEVIIHRTSEGEVLVDVEEFESGVKQNLVLGEETSVPPLAN